ncbi:F-box/LRR-repeat protein 7-like [Temnothorax curvispinosus]|uniref:F-box/LRR-repeat protein 7-like n=1 Tax=Temnothorax curvispinosus TaxID=300111 RepID=A0A6J1RF43_9HYME|nr:F-box/LRR-repeat protein 7-like [Temnothorax curvispinosus]
MSAIQHHIFTSTCCDSELKSFKLQFNTPSFICDPELKSVHKIHQQPRREFPTDSSNLRHTGHEAARTHQVTNKNYIRTCFSTYGHVHACRFVYRNQGFNNCAFVTFTKAADAATAMRDGSITLHDRHLTVRPAYSWYQPDSTEQTFMYAMVGNDGDSTETGETQLSTEQYVHNDRLPNDTENVSIHMLNDHCLKHIFQFLPIVDRVRIEIVCKRWRRVVKNSWHTTKTLDLSPSTWGIAYTHTIPTVVLRKILLKCGKFLTRINLNDPNNSLSEDTLTVIGQLCPNLRNIDVTALTVSASEIRALGKRCRNITELRLGTLTSKCDSELKRLFALNENFRYLAITGNFISGKCLLFLPAQTMRTIILDRCYCLGDAHLSTALKNLENLKHLAISKCARIAEGTFQVVGQHCKTLTTLELNGNFPLAQTTDMSHLNHLVDLQVLKITHNPKVSDHFLIGLVQHCQQLTNVDITGCHYVTNVGLTALASLARLDKLVVSYTRLLTDDGLENVRGLKEFECRRCLFSDRAVTTLIRSSPELRLLDFFGCKNITDSTLEVAKDVCSGRTNNVTLNMICGGTGGILAKKKIGREKVPTLLNLYSNSLYAK